MTFSITEDQQHNYDIFRDCLETALLEKISEPQTKPRHRTKTKSRKKTTAISSESHMILTNNDLNEENNNDQISDAPAQSAEAMEHSRPTQVDDLADFTDYIATETFVCLLPELKTVDYHDYTASSNQTPLPLTSAEIPSYLPILNPSIADSLSAYGIIDEDIQGINEFLAPVLTSFLTHLSTPPPPPSSTRADACEICGRDWINLTYHHLIPRFVHDKAVRRGWHRECDLQNVAWLCGACHRFVHRFAGHEELARRFYSVELLLAEEDVRKWAAWVGRLRWKGR
ncbi:YisB protein [Xylaria nigripes]|nr:YisB protein [Xylaria nigripes]